MMQASPASSVRTPAGAPSSSVIATITPIATIATITPFRRGPLNVGQNDALAADDRIDS